MPLLSLLYPLIGSPSPSPPTMPQSFGSFPMVGKHIDTRTSLREIEWSHPVQSYRNWIMFVATFQKRQKIPCQSLHDSARDA